MWFYEMQWIFLVKLYFKKLKNNTTGKCGGFSASLLLNNMETSREKEHLLALKGKLCFYFLLLVFDDNTLSISLPWRHNMSWVFMQALLRVLTLFLKKKNVVCKWNLCVFHWHLFHKKRVFIHTVLKVSRFHSSYLHVHRQFLINLSLILDYVWANKTINSSFFF